MIKKTLLLLLTLCLIIQTTGIFAQGTTFESASQAVANMKTGWNLGNTLESHASGVTDPVITEKLRTQLITRPELMQMMKEAGFGAIRVPVTWYPHMDASGNVDAAWMARVKEVVDYVIGQGMYCIINVHHDAGKGNTKFPGPGWLKADMNNYRTNKARFEYLWHQIAEEFKDYGQLLVFEGYNEMIDTLNSWNYASYNAANWYNKQLADSAYKAVNCYAQSFVNAVRATGGNNLQRNLIITTYGSCCARGNWNKRLTEPLTRLILPSDESNGHIIVGVNNYPRICDPDDSTLPRPMAEIETEQNNLLDTLAVHITSRGVPIVFCEWGSSNVDATYTDYDNLRSHFLDFADFLITQTKAANIAAFYWMGLSNRTYRAMPAFDQPDLAETILKAWYGDDYIPTLPGRADYDISYNFSYTAQWAEVFLLNTPISVSDYTGLEVEFEEQQVRNRYRIDIFYSNDSESYRIGRVQKATYTFKPENGDSVDRILLKIIDSSAPTSTIVKNIYLVKADGTKENIEPLLEWGKTSPKSDLTVTANPLFIKGNVDSVLYATLYYGTKNLIVPNGVSAKAYKLENGRLIRVKEYGPGSIIPAGTGVVLCADRANVFMFKETTETGEAAVGSMLRGSDVPEMTTGGDIYYMLSLNKDRDPSSVGFYYGKPAGAAFTNAAHKAYLAAPSAVAQAPRYYFVDADEDTFPGTATAINSAAQMSTRAQQKWTTLDGRRLNASPTTPGVYLLNGKKVYIR